MAEFARYYVEFLWTFVQNVWLAIKTRVLALYKLIVTDNIEYFRSIADSVGKFDVLGWIMLIVASVINFVLLFFIIYRVCQLLRRYIFFRAKEVDKDKLMEEVAKLKEQANQLTEEKKQIFALKVNSGLGVLTNDVATNASSEANNDASTPNALIPAPTNAVATNSRFVKLANLDEQYERNPSYIFMEDADMLPLTEIIDRFINFAASQLKLYYTKNTIRQFFAGLATSKIIILEGISGTGKTSLPYAMAKFFNNNASIISVQPSWRDRSELVGYFNEFTKKFNETDFLGSLYEATLREDPNFIVLDEMNLARIEYYFADFLSIMEMPDIAEWKIDLVPNGESNDPKNVIYGKLLVPQNVWFIGTANNDDSTFTITDKVYDRAVALELNEKASYFDAKITQSYNCTYNYVDALFEKAIADHKVSDKNIALIGELDNFIQQKFKIGFGNRVMKQIRAFVPAYIACGGSEMEAIDFMIRSKILRKFNSLNLPFLTKELAELVSFMDRKFGKNALKTCIDYVNQLQKTN